MDDQKVVALLVKTAEAVAELLHVSEKLAPQSSVVDFRARARDLRLLLQEVSPTSQNDQGTL